MNLVRWAWLRNAQVLRRISQVFFFLLIVYGGYLYLKPVDTSLLPFVQTNPNVTKVDFINPSTGYTEVLDTYTPVMTCRYLEGNRIFRACSLHYLTETPSYGVPWTDFLPHFALVVALSFVFARGLCGWVCPLGFLQELLSKFRVWIGLENLQMPKRMMRLVKRLRFWWIAILFLLAVAIAVPFLGIHAFQKEFFLASCQTCPARVIFPVISGAKDLQGYAFNHPVSLIMSAIGILFVSLVLLGFFGKRIWCRFCPNGIMLSLFNRGGLVSLRKENRRCTKCGICKRVCPMGVDRVYLERKKGNVSSANCVYCLQCVSKCPESGCLEARFCGARVLRSKPATDKSNPLRSKTFIK